MKKVLILGGCIIIAISIALLFNTVEKKSVELNGEEIEVRIVDIPVSCSTSSKELKAFFRFEYKGKIHSKNIKDKYCQILKDSRVIKLKTNSDNSVFIFVDENINKEFIFKIVLLIIGLLICYKGIKKTQ